MKVPVITRRPGAVLGEEGHFSKPWPRSNCWSRKEEASVRANGERGFVKDQWELKAALTRSITTVARFWGFGESPGPKQRQSLPVMEGSDYFSRPHPPNHSGVKGKYLEVVMVSVTMLREGILGIHVIFLLIAQCLSNGSFWSSVLYWKN